MEILFGWLAINFIVLLLLLHHMNKFEDWWDVLLYPKLHEYFESEEIDSLGMIFMDIIITLILAPALIVYFVVLAAVLILTLILVGLLELGKKFKK